MAAMVVQFGLAMMPFGGRTASSGLTSETTSGTPGSIRQAEELSITIAPAAATRGAVASDAVLPLENKARSSPLRSAVIGVLDHDLPAEPRQPPDRPSEPRRRTGSR